MLTDWNEVVDGSWTEVDIRGTITCRAGMDRVEIERRAKAALADLMEIETRGMGEPLRISDIYSTIDNVEGVLHVELDSPTATVTAEPSELLVLGNVTLAVEAGT